MTDSADVIIGGSGNAALCAGIAACENGAHVLMLEKAPENMSGGNTKYTAGAMRFCYDSYDDLLPLLANQNDPRVKKSEFGSYTAGKFKADLLRFNDGRALSPEQELLVSESYGTVLWLASHGVSFDPIFTRQSFQKEGKYIFWGGLTLAAENEGVGLFDMELAAFRKLGGEIKYQTKMDSLIWDGNSVGGVVCAGQEYRARAVVLACGGFEANADMRVEYLGPEWENAKVRGTPHNTGDGLTAAWSIGAQKYGNFAGCHATPMDLHMKDFGNLGIPHGERKNYRKISYFLGIMINADGERFVDEGMDFRNYTYAQFGKAILEQPGQLAWQIFDQKVMDLLYAEYRFHDAHFIEADTLSELVSGLEGVNRNSALRTIQEFNSKVDQATVFDPTIKDGKSTVGLEIPKSHWAQTLDTPPFRAYPVTGGITFSYGGLKLCRDGHVTNEKGDPVPGLLGCGEILGGVFYNGYPGGSGLTAGAVFGRRAGVAAAKSIRT